MIIRTATLLLLLTVPSLASAQGFSAGNILVSLANGIIEVRGADGTLQSTMSGPFTGQAKGMAIDADYKLLVAYEWPEDHSNGNTIGVYASDGTYQGNFGSFNCQPLGIVVDRAGNIYISERTCLGRIAQYNAAGKPVQNFNVNSDYVGAWWMDLAPDGCTMFYTSDGQNIQRYDICNNVQLPNFNNVPLGDPSYAGALGLRILPDGSVLIANHYDVQHLDPNGNVIGLYYGLADNGLAAIALDRDGTTFWVTDTAASKLLHMNINDGTILGIFPTGDKPKAVIIVPPRP